MEQDVVDSREKGRRERGRTSYLALLLEVGNDIVTLLGLLETVEGHLGTRNVFLSKRKPQMIHKKERQKVSKTKLRGPLQH